MEAKTYSVKRDGKPPVSVTGFPEEGNRRPFISLKIGDSFGGEFAMILYLTDASALAVALEDAINYADARVPKTADRAPLEEVA